MLSLWVAGAGCLLGCEGMMAAAPSATQAASHIETSPSLIVSGHACSSAEVNSSHNCCKKTAANAQPEAPKNANHDPALTSLQESSSGSMANCPFAMSRNVIVAKTRTGDIHVAPVVTPQVFPPSTDEQTVTLSAPLQIPNRGHTYLRCCVFLI